MTDAIKNTSKKLTKTFTETSIKNKKAREIINENVLELMNDKGMLAPYLASSLVNLLRPENKSNFILVNDDNSIKVNDFLINRGIPITLYSNMLTFSDSNKHFNLDGDLSETMTNYDFKVSHSNPKDQKLIYEFGKEMNFNIQQKERKSDRDKSPKILFKSPAMMASAISTTFLPSDLNELWEKLKSLLLEKQTGKNSNIINNETVTIVDKLLKYKCIFKKQHEKFSIKCNLLHTKN